MRYVKIFLFLIFSGLTIRSAAQTTNYQVYALFVVNIAKYSEFPNLVADMHITVYGKSKVFDELAKQNGKSVNGHPLKITQTDNLTELSQPQIIYIADGKSASLDEIIKATEGKHVMIICEREGLYKKGAGFSFIITENSNLRFDINNTELEKRQIKVSKSLSALANAAI